MTREADRLAGSGFGGEIYESASGMIRRKATDTLLLDSYRRQCRFLPELAAHVPLAVPLPVWNDDGSMSYRRLAGRPLQPEMLPTMGAARLAEELALFLAALHSISTASAIEWGVTPASKTSKLLAAADRVLPELPVGIRERARAWRSLFHEPPHPNVLIHGDLWHENLLVDARSGRLSGVIDFDETSIGDPAWDFATQLHCGEEFTRLVIDRYPQSVGDPTLLSRARALFALRTFEGLDWALRHKDEAEFKQSLQNCTRWKCSFCQTNSRDSGAVASFPLISGIPAIGFGRKVHQTNLPVAANNRSVFNRGRRTKQTFMESFLKNKRVVVTGASKGIGLAVAEALVAEGAHVALCARNADSLTEAVAQIKGKSDGGKVLAHPADVSDSAQVANFFRFVDKELDGLDILINNAGFGVFRSTAELTVEEWDRLIATNLSGAFYCSREALQRFEQQREGFIINISSLAGKNPFAGGSAYNASKFGLNGFSEAMMLDHRNDNVRVSYIMPGSVATQFGGEEGEHSDWKIAPEDIAEIVLDVLRLPKRTLMSRIEVRPSRPVKY